MSPEKRKKYTYILEDIQNSSVNWRFRKLIGKQIGSLASVYDFQTNYTDIVPLVHALIQDPVARVREATIPEVGKVIQSLEVHKQKEFLDKLQQLGTHETYQQRIVFAKICSSAVSTLDVSVFENVFLENLLKLSKDKVPNVRVAAAHSLKEISKNANFNVGDTRISDALQVLTTDPDTDVVITAGGIPQKRYPKQ